MKKTLLLLFILCVVSCARPILDVETSVPHEQQISAVLDDFHAAASEADSDRYFGHFTSDAVLIGTDATERWSLEEFRPHLKPILDQGRGWTYTMTSRHVFCSKDQRTAWFDEMTQNEKLGECRGTGVLVWEESVWKIAQYHLTIPIPNDLAHEFVTKIREFQTKEPGQ